MRTFRQKLASLFCASANVNHWQALRQMMEKDLSPVILHAPIEGGDVLAYFKNRVLIWDGNSYEIKGGVKIIRDVKEPVGTGKTASRAVISLFDQLTDLDFKTGIMRVDPTYSENGSYFKYTHLSFKDGLFKSNPGTVETPITLAPRDPRILKAQWERESIYPSEAALAHNTRG